ncbi:MAG: site-specific DNA-methyltransferase [Oscillibacter sp.]|uniref:DNA methyltransferase n=1 Tax=Oscillibacter sp. TaxID=1945593 RepID=UPI001322B547|nr:site-specific DNA-methyltransferase [Oscillibacter sp.]MUU10433.1 site-specific DNA-methyltransferase [Oscillibacter sp.]
MDHLDLEAPGLTAGNVEKIAALFPAAVTETRGADGKVKKAVNFEVLKQLLAPDVAEGEERYEFTWVGKRAAMAEAARPTSRTLRPVKADSRDWDTTRNLYIEGDNLEVLKILQESYLGAVKVIYLDPPYNTGSDFIYPDSFVMDRGVYHGASGYRDAEGKINFQRKNTFSDGRYHSDWCSMLFSRLLLARSLLSPDGVILISIDDHESANLKKICDEVFGESNYLNQFAWVSNIAGRQISGRGAAKTWSPSWPTPGTSTRAAACLLTSASPGRRCPMRTRAFAGTFGRTGWAPLRSAIPSTIIIASSTKRPGRTSCSPSSISPRPRRSPQAPSGRGGPGGSSCRPMQMGTACTSTMPGGGPGRRLRTSHII